MSILDSTVSGNTTGGFPDQAGSGGINNAGLLIVFDSTITDNGRSFLGAGGIANNGSTAVLLRGSIVAGNNVDCAGPVDSDGDNLDGDGSCNLGEPGDQTADPLLGPLQDNGGPTFTHEPLPDSPAVDAATRDCPPPFVDQRGVPRPQGPACDIGSVELGVPEPAVFGDWNCSGGLDGADGMPLLHFLAELQFEPPQLCPEAGDSVLVDGEARLWLDSDCDGAPSLDDVLSNFLAAAGLPPEPAGDCPRLGDPILLLK
jgi:hypothetical protein